VDTRLGIRHPSGSSPADALALNHLTRCGGLSRSLRFPLLQQRTSQRASGRGREPRRHPCQRERSNRLTPETADPCQSRKKAPAALASDRGEEVGQNVTVIGDTPRPLSAQPRLGNGTHPRSSKTWHFGHRLPMASAAVLRSLSNSREAKSNRQRDDSHQLRARPHQTQASGPLPAARPAKA
jgi:hypothetical protein